MADDTTSLNEKNFLETPHTELNFLNSEDNAKEEARRDAAPVVTHLKTVPGRRTLFRN
jgi:hypothetical protein